MANLTHNRVNRTDSAEQTRAARADVLRASVQQPRVLSPQQIAEMRMEEAMAAMEYPSSC